MTQETITTGPWTGFEVIHRYTRAEALADGVLVDVTELAKACGYHAPTVLSAAMFADCEQAAGELSDVPAETRLQAVLRDVLATARSACLARPDQENPRTYFPMPGILRGATPPAILHVGAGDDGEAVVTLMYPSDD